MSFVAAVGGGMLGGGDWLAGWITVTGTVMCAGTLSTLLLTSSHAMAAMGRYRILPSWVGKQMPGALLEWLPSLNVD